MIFEFGHHKIDIDVEKTKAFYHNAENVTKHCNCPGCRNFEQAVAVINPNVISLFSAMGIDMKKAAEVYGIDSYKEGMLYYGGFYHVCGQIVCGGYTYNKIDDKTYELERESVIVIDENFEFGFTEEIDLLEDDFPEPVVQLEFHATIPWVLDEKISY